MSYQPEIPLTFESRDGTTVATFGVAQFEFDFDQPLMTPTLPLVGASYVYDQLGTGIALVKPWQMAIRYLELQSSPSAVDTAIRDMQSKLRTIGLGKLWTADSTGARYWAYARATKAPGLKWQAGQIFQKSVNLLFEGRSDFVAATPTVVTISYANTPHTFTVTNPGSRRITNAVILLSGTWADQVTITNTTNGYGFAYDGGDSGSSPADQVRFDSGANRVDRSYDGGLTWSNAFANYAPNTGQLQMMILEPGVNNFTVTDGATPNASLVFTFYQ